MDANIKRQQSLIETEMSKEIQQKEAELKRKEENLRAELTKQIQGEYQQKDAKQEKEMRSQIKKEIVA